MNTYNSDLRKLREKYKRARAIIRHQYEKKEQEISSEIDMRRNEHSFWLAKLKMGEEPEKAKNQMALLTVKIKQLQLNRIELKFDTRNALILLELDQHQELNQIEKEHKEKGAQS